MLLFMIDFMNMSSKHCFTYLIFFFYFLQFFIFPLSNPFYVAPWLALFRIHGLFLPIGADLFLLPKYNSDNKILVI